MTLHPEDDDWGQARTLVREVLDLAARERLVANTVDNAGKTRVPEIRERAIQYWENVDARLGARVEAAPTPITEPRISPVSEPVRTPAVF